MPEYLSPGVYIEEKPSGSKPIAGVSTSTGGFVGIAEKGPVGKAVLITNMTQFAKTFGGHVKDTYLYLAMQQFFTEGGTRGYVVRACNYTAGNPNATEAQLSFGEKLSICASSQGEWANNTIAVYPTKSKIDDKLFRIMVLKLTKNPKDETKYQCEILEKIDGLNAENVKEALDKKSEYIRVTSPGLPAVMYGVDMKDCPTFSESNEKQEPTAEFVQKIALQGGSNGMNEKGKIVADSFIGDEASKNGLHAFDNVEDVNIIAIPDLQSSMVEYAGGTDCLDYAKKAYAYCESELRKDCVFLVDAPKGMDPQQVLQARKEKLASTSYAAMYYPWIVMLNSKGKVEVPPSGAIAGIYARTDNTRGVHKAPAGVNDGQIRTSVGLERVLTKGEHDTLNEPGINVLRYFPGIGNVVWGCRTLSSGDPEWKYVPIRRLFLFLEKSIYAGTQWVVFEPNNPTLWGAVKRNLRAFLLTVWRDGALFGNTAEEAFFVKVDEENNPPESRNAGKLIIDVGVAPVRPAEFVIIRISQKLEGKD